MKRRFILISYDIVDKRKRARIARLMEANGVRVQKSVFECWLSERQYLELRGKLEGIIDLKTDTIRYYQLCKDCVMGIEYVGVGSSTTDDEIVVI